MALTDNPLAPGIIRPGIVNNVTNWRKNRSGLKVSNRVITVDPRDDRIRQCRKL